MRCITDMEVHDIENQAIVGFNNHNDIENQAIVGFNNHNANTS